MLNLTKKKDDVTDVITHDVTPLTVNTDAGAYSKLGWWIVLAGVGGFLLWASFAPLDKGVPLSGNVSTEGNRKTIQYQPGGTVQDILVKDGDQVKAGQVLVRMNDVAPRSQVEMNRAQYIIARLTEARLLAESEGRHGFTLPAALNELKADPRVIEGLALQNQLLASRQQALSSELSSYDENIAGLKEEISGLQASGASIRAQTAILKEQLDNNRDLAKEGYVARSHLLEIERTNAQLAGTLAENIGNIGHAQRQILEASMRRAQRSGEYQKEVRTQLSDAQKEAETLLSRSRSFDFDLASVDVKAPVDGIVVGSAIFTRGGVVAPGFHMMDLVPVNDALVVEAQVPTNLIDKVHVGLPAELIFSAFNANRTPHIPGEVIQVSADRTVDERTGNSYYKLRARVTPEGAKIIAAKKLDIQSGMPVEMFVKTGERTMMNYLLKPVFDRSKSSMAEE